MSLDTALKKISVIDPITGCNQVNFSRIARARIQPSAVCEYNI